jgi:myo-inositol 2-dehydrogenase / D-chiro-inositol 1-dehydrogenase
LITLRTADGVLSTVETFLNARYGYDIRCEVVGETGAISLTEPARTRTDAALQQGISYAGDWRPRFADAYRLELQAWVDSVRDRAPTPLATGRDGLAASRVAEAVIASMRADGRTTKVAP